MKNRGQTEEGKVYFPTINLLRGIAALLVVFFHLTGYSDFRGNLFPPDSLIVKMGHSGAHGVFMFFVISGFVIPLAMAQSGFKLRYLHCFLARRFVRIEIPYFASIALILLVGYLFAFKNGNSYSVNPLQVFYHIIYVIPFTKFDWYNGIYWTLAIEFQFYILIGCLYALITHKNKFIQYGTLIAFGVTAFLTKDDRFIFHFSLFFLQGIVLFLIMTKKIDTKIGWLFLLLFLGLNLYLHSPEKTMFSVFTIVCIAFVTIDKKWTNRFGAISYSLYLTHGLTGMNLLYFFARYANNDAAKYFLILGGIIVALVLAYIFWKIVEEPSVKLSKKVKAVG